MQLPDEGSLPRREFLRRSAMGAAVLAAIGGGVAHGGAGSVLAQLAGDPMGELPAQPVAAVGVLDGTVVAVGGVRGAPCVWCRTALDQPWLRTAGPEAFPAGTALTGLAIDRTRAVAVGCLGPDHATVPAVFSSRDLRSWNAQPGTGAGPGVLTGVAFSSGRGLAVGARFAQPEVEEPVDTIAFRQTGGRWEPASLPGVRPVRHGAVTLLANVGDRLLLGLTDVLGLALYGAPGAEGPWRSLEVPRCGVPLAPVAAVAAGGTTLLAGIDAADHARFWRRTGRSWIEVDPPAGVPATVKVRALRRAGDGQVIVAGGRGHRGFVREVTVS